MNSIFNVVEAGQKGDNSAVEALSRMDWFRMCISEQLDNVWKTYGGKMFADVYENMDYDYIMTLLSFTVAKQVCMPSEGYDVRTRLGNDAADTSVKAYVRKYIRSGVFKGEWMKVFYSYAYETHPSIGESVSTFKRNMSVYTWFLSNSVSKTDIDKSDDEIIASIDLNAINKRYASEDEDNPTTHGKVQNEMKKDLSILRAWFTNLGDISYADVDYSSQDVVNAFVDETIVNAVKERLAKLSERQKKCYISHVVYKWAGPKTADALGISEASVRRYSNQAKDAIMADLEQLMK